MKLTYFKAPARAEPARLMLGVTKTAYTDVNIGREDWQALKPKTKYGQVPVLELNDGRQLAQVRSSDDRAHSVTNQSEQAKPWLLPAAAASTELRQYKPQCRLHAGRVVLLSYQHTLHSMCCMCGSLCCTSWCRAQRKDRDLAHKGHANAERSHHKVCGQADRLLPRR